MKALLGRLRTSARIEPPFHCDYGSNIELGDGVFINSQCVVLDCAPVRIGSGTLFGPGVPILTPLHPLDATKRRSGVEWAAPVTIGESFWVGGGALILPGVTIGTRAVIGAGSVVTRDVPEGVLAVGNPGRVVRRLETLSDNIVD